jgi:hypothetical protein
MNNYIISSNNCRHQLFCKKDDLEYLKGLIELVQSMNAQKGGVEDMEGGKIFFCGNVFGVVSR